MIAPIRQNYTPPTLTELPLDVRKIIAEFLKPYERYPLCFVSKKFSFVEFTNAGLYLPGINKCSIVYLEWVKQLNHPLIELDCLTAVSLGEIEILKWMKKNDCPWNEDACKSAVTNGNLEVLKWLIENGCSLTKTLFSVAAAKGQLETLNWLRENECTWDYLAYISAAENGHHEVVKWLNKKGPLG